MEGLLEKFTKISTPFRTLQEENESLTWGNPASDKDLPVKETVPKVPELPKSTVIAVAPMTVDTTTEVSLTLPSL